MKYIYILFLLLFASNSFATEYHWKGGSGDYNDPNMWWLYSFNSGTTAIQAPVSTDDVYFAAAAFTASGAIITINSNANCHDMIWDNTITTANMPRVTGANSIRLDIYGSFTLADNLNWQYGGNMRFRSTDTLALIDTKGHTLKTANLYFDGTDSTEFRLTNPLYMANINISVYSGIQLNKGYFNANGFDLIINSIHFARNSLQNPLAGVTNNSVGFNIKNSKVTIYRFWIVGSGINKFHTFNTDSSHVRFVRGGNAVRALAGFTFDTLTMCPNSRFDGNSPYIKHLYTDGYFQIYRGSRPIIENWHIGNNASFIEFTYGNNWATIENIFMPAQCGKYVTFQRTPGTTGTQKMIKKSFNDTLFLEQAILQGIFCDISNSRTYIANNSLDVGGNDPAWQYTSSAGRELYFRATTNNIWSNPNNWEIWDGSSFLPNSGGCLPSPYDNVYFDSLSFKNGDSTIIVDSVSYCHNMYWFDQVKQRSTIYFRQDLKTFGSLRLSNTMRTISSSNRNVHLWEFFGHDPDSIQTNGVYMNVLMDVRPNAYYELIGDLDGYYLRGAIKSRIHAKDLEIRVATMTIDSGLFHNIYAWLNSFSGGLNTLYTGYSTYEFSPANGVSGDYFYAGYSSGFLGASVRMPNVICNKHFTSSVNVPNVYVEGDLTFKEGFTFTGQSYRRNVYVRGTMPLFSGDMHVQAGFTYTFSSYYKLNVADTLHSVGDCIQMVNWTSVIPTEMTFAHTNIDYNFIRGWKNLGSLITANNSVDGGTNTNVDFPLSTGVTYYWRANANDNTDFEGTWNTPTHWTTNPADLVGTLGCLPTLADTVIFDNLSLSASSNGCTIANLAYCNTLIIKSDILLNGGNDLYISNSLILEDITMTWSHSGKVLFVGDGTNSIIDTRNVYLNWARMSIDNNLGNWDIISQLRSRGGFVIYNGTLTSNGHNLDIGGLHQYGGHFDFQDSYISILRSVLPGTSAPWVDWLHSGGTLNSDNSTILTNQNQFQAGGATYNHVILGTSLCSSCTYLLTNGGTFKRLDILGNAEFRANNTIDTLVLHGGNFYYLYANTTQTLSAPYGVIEVEDVGPGQFVNVESHIAGQKAYFHKEYGQAFCVDWIKVKDNEATKGSSAPAPWDSNLANLLFETGNNSDNIAGTATGIWAFDMPPILTVATNHAPVIDFCAGDTTIYIPITMTGTYPYSIIYSWTNIWGETGLDTIVVTDDDSDVLTPFVYNLELHPYTSTTYTLDIAALRCGGRNFGAPITTVLAQLPKDVLVSQDRQGSCILNNNSVWAHFADDVEQKPMLSILDSTALTDNSALGLVDAQTNFDATIQYWNGKPYLPRHWKVDVANNGAGKVRLYFTQDDINKLQTATVDDNINPATELILYKFDDTITVGTPVQIPFTVIPLVGRAADPFADITDVFAIEFEVTSFSGFLLQPTDLATFPLDLLAFEAKNSNNKAVELNWSIANVVNVSHFEIERSTDGINFEAIGNLAIAPSNYYNYLDASPLNGTSYYRLKIVDEDASFEYSPIRSVELISNNLFEIAPNPIVDNNLKVRIATKAASALQLQVFNNLGQKVWQKEVSNTQDGINYYQFPMPKLADGQYILQMTNEQGQQQQRFILRN